MSKLIVPRKKVLFTEEILQDPYPAYARLHEEGPLHYLDVDGKWALWSIVSHAECSSAAKDPRLSAKRSQQMILSLPISSQSEFSELARMLGLWLIFMDPPEHTRLRKLLNKGFSPAAIEGLRPQVEAIVDQMLKPLQNGSEVELMREFANPMPVRIILEMLGIPQDLRDTFVNWSRDIAVFRGSPDRTVEQARAAQDALIALTDFFRQTVAERRRNKGNDLISLLIDIEEEGEVLTEEELYAQCIALLFAGHETTRNLIGNGMYTLLRHPEETAELRENPVIIRSAVEEILRYESPVQFTARVLKEDVEISEKVVGPMHARCSEPRSKAIQGTGSVRPEEAEQPTLGVQRGATRLHRRPTCTVRGTGCAPESSAALPGHEAQRTKTGMGAYIWVQGLEESFGNNVKL